MAPEAFIENLRKLWRSFQNKFLMEFWTILLAKIVFFLKKKLTNWLNNYDFLKFCTEKSRFFSNWFLIDFSVKRLKSEQFLYEFCGKYNVRSYFQFSLQIISVWLWITFERRTRTIFREFRSSPAKQNLSSVGEKTRQNGNLRFHPPICYK